MCCVSSVEIQVENVTRLVYVYYQNTHKICLMFLARLFIREKWPSLKTLDLFYEYFGNTATCYVFNSTGMDPENRHSLRQRKNWERLLWESNTCSAVCQIMCACWIHCQLQKRFALLVSEWGEGAMDLEKKPIKLDNLPTTFL